VVLSALQSYCRIKNLIKYKCKIEIGCVSIKFTSPLPWPLLLRPMQAETQLHFAGSFFHALAKPSNCEIDGRNSGIHYATIYLKWAELLGNMDWKLLAVS
jgi:hypothetical protein